MSTRATRWGYEVSITGPKKAVLMALCDHADDDGQCWPATARLALFSGFDERTVRNALRSLEAAGLISTVISGGRTSNRYTINVGSQTPAERPQTRNDVPPREDRDSVLEPVQPGTTFPAPRQEIPRTPESLSVNPESPSINPEGDSAKPLRTTKNHHGTTNEPDDDPDQMEFWKLYPRKKDGHGSIRKPWVKARAKASAEQIIDGLRRYPFSAESQFWPMPSTWLNQERWLTERDTKPQTIILNGTPRKPTSLDATRAIMGLNDEDEYPIIGGRLFP